MILMGMASGIWVKIIMIEDWMVLARQVTMGKTMVYGTRKPILIMMLMELEIFH